MRATWSGSAPAAEQSTKAPTLSLIAALHPGLQFSAVQRSFTKAAHMLRGCLPHGTQHLCATVQDATRRDTAVGAMKQYARALIDGNLAEVAIYAGNGPGAVFKGTDSHGNRCVWGRLLRSGCNTCGMCGRGVHTL